MFHDSLCIQLLSKHMLGLKFTNCYGSSFFYTYTLHTCFRIHSPYSYLVYTLQAHVRFKIFKFAQKLFFFMLTLSTHVSGFFLHTVIWFTLSKHMLGSKFSIFSGDHFFMLTLSTHVSGFTLHTVIWFTLSKHMLGSKFSNFHRRISFFSYLLSTHVSEFTLHAVVFTLSKQMLHFKILYSYYNFIMCLNAPLNHECLTP